MSKTWADLRVDVCGLSSDIWASVQMWEHSSSQVWVVLHVWMQLGQETNHTYLNNPSLTAQIHTCTQETNTHRDVKNTPTPSWGTCLTQSGMCLFPPLLWNDSVSSGGFERLKPCLEDNLGWTIWSRFPSLFSGFPLSSHVRKRKNIFVVLTCNRNAPRMWFTASNSTPFAAETAACAAFKASSELCNLYLFHYWSLPVASAHLDTSAHPV